MKYNKQLRKTMNRDQLTEGRSQHPNIHVIGDPKGWEVTENICKDIMNEQFSKFD